MISPSSLSIGYDFFYPTDEPPSIGSASSSACNFNIAMRTDIFASSSAGRISFLFKEQVNHHLIIAIHSRRLQKQGKLSDRQRGQCRTGCVQGGRGGTTYL
jgi:hypothetical protein